MSSNTSTQNLCIIRQNYTITYENAVCGATLVSGVQNKTTIKASDFRCLLTNLSDTLIDTGILHISGIIVLIIMYISICGKIKESYRWFILNQALWDLVTIYESFCFNRAYTTFGYETRRCFLGWPAFTRPYLGYHFVHWFSINPSNNSYSAFLLLSLSRYFCLYFSNFYEKLTRPFRLFSLLLGVNILCILIQVPDLWIQDYITGYPITDFKKYQANLYYWGGIREKVRHVMSALPLIYMGISLFAILSVIFKVAKQSAYQHKNNRKDFVNSLRLTIVLALQWLLNLFIIILEILDFIGGFTVSSQGCGSTAGLSNTWLFWIDPTWGMSNSINYQTIKIFRVLFESLLILILLTGYRESLTSIFMWAYFAIKKTRAAVEDVRRRSMMNSQTSVIVINPLAR